MSVLVQSFNICPVTFQQIFCMCSVLSGGGGSGGGGGYGGFFLACEYFGDCSTNHSPPALFLSFIFFVCVRGGKLGRTNFNLQAKISSQWLSEPRQR